MTVRLESLTCVAHQGSAMASPSLNVLVLSDFNNKDANVVRDYLYSFNQHSRHHFYYLHAWSKNQFRRLRNLDFNRFDAVILFWDFYWIGSDDPLSYCYVPDWVAKRVAESRAVKIQFLQDEYRDVRLANRVMSRFGVNVMFSCVAPKDQDIFYPKALIPSLVATYPVLTGYVPSYLEHVQWPASIDRRIDIGYRSRRLAYYLGSLGQEKGDIADRFQGIAQRYGFSADISVREEDRIYGEDWLEFMKSCRFSLGTESGASVVDFDGTIRKQCVAHVRDHPGATFEQVRDRFFPGLDGKVVVQTISPRIFEAAAFENTLVLHEGRYEDMLAPDVHYISVKKDYSNIEDVVERMRDRAFCERLARAAKEQLIGSKKYNYQSFVKSFDTILERHATAKGRAGSVSRTLFYLANYVNNDRLIPRGGKAVSIPHACDVVFYYNHYAPYVVVMLCTLNVLLNLVSQAPALVLALLRRTIAAARSQGVSLAGVMRDVRLLALFLEMRSGLRAVAAPAFDLRLAFDRDARILRGISVPAAANERQHDPSGDDDALADIDRAETPFSIQWDTQLVGNGVPLRWITSGNYCIYLNNDCIYRFEHLNALRWSFSADEASFLKKLLAGGWQAPTLAQKAVALGQICRTIAAWLLVEVPARCLQRLGVMRDALPTGETAVSTKPCDGGAVTTLNDAA